MTIDAEAARQVPTGIKGLDDMLRGGVLEGDSTLVAGSPGTGKTTMGLHFIGEGIKHGEPGVYVTFEYLPQQMYRDAGRKGWPLRQWEDEDMLRVICTTPEVLMARDEDGNMVLDEMIAEIGGKRLVMDSMTHFEFLGAEHGDLRDRIAGLMNHMRLLDTTTLLTHEIPQIIGPTVQISNYGLEFLVDNVIMLRYVELESELQKAINILKFRGGDHDRRYRSFRLTDEGMKVEADFEGVENISSGSARRSFSKRAQELV